MRFRMREVLAGERGRRGFRYPRGTPLSLVCGVHEFWDLSDHFSHVHT